MADDPSSIGAILIGALLALFLSGVVSMQVFVYFEVYRNDRYAIKSLVVVIWVLDIIHSALLCDTAWIYLVLHRTYDSPASMISWTIVPSICLTAITTFTINSFYGHRLWTLSNHNLYLVVPIMLLNCLRLSTGIATSVELTKKDTWHEFFLTRAWLFTIGLAASSVLDVIVAISLITLLRKGRSGFQSMDQVVRTLTRFTIETGALTSVIVIVTLVFWLAMPHNQVFLASYFTISKLYANAFLATLNARKVIHHRTRASSSSVRSGLPTPRFVEVRSSQIHTADSSNTAREVKQQKGFRAGIHEVFYRHVEDVQSPVTITVPSAPV